MDHGRQFPAAGREGRVQKGQAANGDIVNAQAEYPDDPERWLLRAQERLLGSTQRLILDSTSASEELAKEKPNDDAVKPIVCKFMVFLVNMMQSPPCYPDFIKFKGIFPRLTALAAGSIEAAKLAEATLLEHLANTPADGNTVPGVDGISVFVASMFTTCPLYGSFVSARGKARSTLCF